MPIQEVLNIENDYKFYVFTAFILILILISLVLNIYVLKTTSSKSKFTLGSSMLLCRKCIFVSISAVMARNLA